MQISFIRIFFPLLFLSYFANSQNQFIPPVPTYGIPIPMLAYNGIVICMARDNTPASSHSIFKLNTTNNNLSLIPSDTALGAISLRNFLELDGKIYFTGRFGLHQIDLNSNAVKRVAKFNGINSYIFAFNGKLLFAFGDSKMYVYNPALEAVDTLKYNNTYVNPGTYPQVLVNNNKLFFIGQGTGAQIGFSYIYEFEGVNKSVLRSNQAIASGSISINIPFDGRNKNFTPLAVNGQSIFWVMEGNLTTGLASFNLSNINNISPNYLKYGGGFDHITKFDNQIFFKQSTKIWKTNGINLAEIASDIDFDGFSTLQNNAYATVQGKLIGTKTDMITGMEPWVSDGTTAGTKLLFDIFKGERAISNNVLIPNSSYMHTPFLSEGNLYFMAANTGSLYSESDGFNFSYYIWKTDGTPEGTLKYSSIECNYVLSTDHISKSNGSIHAIGKIESDLGLISLKPIQYIGGEKNWEAAESWSGNIVPGPKDDVQVKNGTLQIHSAATVRSILVGNSAAIHIMPGYSLNIVY
jgi:ELWxxDGT repeat protein